MKIRELIANLIFVDDLDAEVFVWQQLTENTFNQMSIRTVEEIEDGGHAFLHTDPLP